MTSGSASEGDVRPSVFVLMPFADNFFPVYEKLIKEPLDNIGFEVKRADSDLNQQSILRDFVDGIVKAELVVADVTDLNSNVMYELGLAHALGARVVVIAQDITVLPFDLQPYRANSYSTEFHRAHELSDLLTSIGAALLDGSADFGNPIQDYAPGALRESAPILRHYRRASEPEPEGDGSSTASDAVHDADTSSGPGFLEAVVELEDVGQRMQSLGLAIGGRTQTMAEAFTMHTQRMESSQKRLGQQATPAVLAIVNQIAMDLDGYVADLNPKADDFKVLLDQYAQIIEVISKEAVISSAADVTAARENIEALRGLEGAFSESVNGIQSFAVVMEQAPNASKRLRQSSKRTVATVNRLAGYFEDAVVETARGRGILESRVDAYLRSLKG